MLVPGPTVMASNITTTLNDRPMAIADWIL